ncbi:O-antigen polysaccharide polymerase Wzy [Bacillus sp. T33-2]|uniref:O-antigen polysaccharide polymerase Wzy n=1 Tax=Bacillus sp. T33-2 TaxID=2054168 RepID=UPI000C776956|nr:O-antigen polysaccharide polymerase Wzy [Bacillus sp. T33-2]PLR91236.1 hypothetical protein CVD19_21845 [Bacillus sp. T33-2]
MFIQNIKNALGMTMIYQLVLCCASILILVCFLPFAGFEFNTQLYIVSLTGTLAFAFSVFFYYKETGYLFSPYIMFYYAFFLFHFGQCFLILLPFDYDYFVFERFNEKTVINGSIYTVFSLIIFNLGALVSNKRKPSFNGSLRLVNSDPQILRKMGYIIFFLSIIPAFYISLQETIISLMHGYNETYSNPINEFFVFVFLQYLFIPSCILLLTSLKKDDYKANVVKVIAYMYAGILLVGGGRTEGIAIFLTLLFYSHITGKKFNKQSLVKLGLVLGLIIILIPTLANFRIIENKSFSSFFSELQDSIVSNPIVETIGELGYSISPLYMTIDVIPDDLKYKYGESYLASIFTIIPANLDFTGLFSQYNETAALDEWLKNQYDMDFGPGFSMVAESYYNFGYWGIIVIFIWGLIIGRLLGYADLSHILNNRLTLYIKLVGLYSLLTFPRRSSIFFVDQITYLVLSVFIGVLLMRKVKEIKTQTIGDNHEDN